MTESTPGHSEAPLMLSVSGCRGIMGASLTDAVVRAFAAETVAWAGRHREADRTGPMRVVVARDGRRGGEAIKATVIDAVRGVGADVIDLDVATTPTTGVMVLHHRADTGLIVTASHNPGEWNGLKAITSKGGAPAPDEARELIDEIRSVLGAPVADRVEGARGSVTEGREAARVHVDRVLQALDRVFPVEQIRDKRHRVVLDSVNASGRIGGRMLLEALGCDVVHLNADASGVFPHVPEPTAENLKELCTQVKAQGASIGFAQDPDADRLAIVDERGGYIGEEYTLVLGALALLESLAPEDAKRVVLAANLSTSRMIDDVVSEFGARVVRTAVGEANVVAGMRAAESVLGGEGNGGVIWPEIVPIRDSLGAMGLVLALMTKRRTNVGAIVDGLPRYAIVKRKVPISPGLGDRAGEAVAGLWPEARIDRQDGVRVDLADVGGGPAWVHVRASNTEPILRLIAEAVNEEAAEEVLAMVEGVVGR